MSQVQLTVEEGNIVISVEDFVMSLVGFSDYSIIDSGKQMLHLSADEANVLAKLANYSLTTLTISKESRATLQRLLPVLQAIGARESTNDKGQAG